MGKTRRVHNAYSKLNDFLNILRRLNLSSGDYWDVLSSINIVNYTFWDYFKGTRPIKEAAYKKLKDGNHLWWQDPIDKNKEY